VHESGAYNTNPEEVIFNGASSPMPSFLDTSGEISGIKAGYRGPGFLCPAFVDRIIIVVQARFAAPCMWAAGGNEDILMKHEGRRE
jgi:hypothetical protein